MGSNAMPSEPKLGNVINHQATGGLLDLTSKFNGSYMPMK